MNGLSGLEQGMHVQGQLLERFGHDIHPQAEDGDQEQRMGSLTWFIVRMSTLTRQVHSQRIERVYNLNDYEAAKQLHRQLQRNPDAAAPRKTKLRLTRFPMPFERRPRIATYSGTRRSMIASPLSGRQSYPMGNNVASRLAS
jgi:predicted component of type VI protein secretion system